MLPMFASRPIVLGGLVAPVLWSGLLYTILGLLNPLLASHIDWPWFIASQVAFGVVAGSRGRAPGAQADARESFLCIAGGHRSSRAYSTTPKPRGGPVKQKRLRYPCASAALGMTIMLLSSCGSPHGQPQKGSETFAPNEVLEFRLLSTQKTARAATAPQGRGGAAIALADPVYLAIVDGTAMRNVITNGARGTSMPAFAQSAGGMLTVKQIDVITSGIFSHWARKGILDGVDPPSYAAKSPGNSAQGELVYETYCASCHGPEGQGGPKGSAITNDSFLALVSDQGLRTVVIAGRPEFGAPDWRGDFRESLCRTRKSPMSLPGSHHAACKTRGSLIPLPITHSTRSQIDAG